MTSGRQARYQTRNPWSGRLRDYGIAKIGPTANPLITKEWALRQRHVAVLRMGLELTQRLGTGHTRATSGSRPCR